VSLGGEIAANRSDLFCRFDRQEGCSVLQKTESLVTPTVEVVDSTVAQILQLPPALGAEQLAALLDRAPSSVLADVSRAPHKLPPWCALPGTQRKVWLTATVLSWLAKNEVAPVAKPAEPAPTAPKPRRGRPRNADRAANRIASDKNDDAPSDVLVGWSAIEDFKSTKIGDRLSRSTVERLVKLGYLRLGRAPGGQVRVSIVALEEAWLAREAARDADWRLPTSRKRGCRRDPFAAAAPAPLRPEGTK
jgi:hypothetical protein